MRGTFSLLVLGLLVLAASPAAAFTDLRGKDGYALETPALPDLGGTERRVSDWKGKVVLLNFWATWCVPCQVEIRELIGLQQRFGARNLQVVGVALDTPERIRNFVRSFHIPYPVLAAGEGNLAMTGAWGNPEQQVPYTVVIAPDGRIVYNQFGVFTPDIFELLVEPMLSPAS